MGERSGGDLVKRGGEKGREKERGGERKRVTAGRGSAEYIGFSGASAKRNQKKKVEKSQVGDLNEHGGIMTPRRFGTGGEGKAEQKSIG